MEHTVADAVAFAAVPRILHQADGGIYPGTILN